MGVEEEVHELTRRLQANINEYQELCRLLKAHRCLRGVKFTEILLPDDPSRGRKNFRVRNWDLTGLGPLNSGDSLTFRRGYQDRRNPHPYTPAKNLLSYDVYTLGISFKYPGTVAKERWLPIQPNVVPPADLAGVDLKQNLAGSFYPAWFTPTEDAGKQY